jgi:hypothetical protein
LPIEIAQVLHVPAGFEVDVIKPEETASWSAVRAKHQLVEKSHLLPLFQFHHQ